MRNRSGEAGQDPLACLDQGLSVELWGAHQSDPPVPGRFPSLAGSLAPMCECECECMLVRLCAHMSVKDPTLGKLRAFVLEAPLLCLLQQQGPRETIRRTPTRVLRPVAVVHMMRRGPFPRTGLRGSLDARVLPPWASELGAQGSRGAGGTERG